MGDADDPDCVTTFRILPEIVADAINSDDMAPPPASDPEPPPAPPGPDAARPPAAPAE